MPKCDRLVTDELRGVNVVVWCELDAPWKSALLQTLMTELKEECDMHNFYLTRLVREVKREINLRVASQKTARAKHWRKARNMVGMVMKFRS